MIYISKGHASSEIVQEINRVKRDNDWGKVRPSDSETARAVFDQIDKGMIRKQLLTEQKQLCAYCMRRIGREENDMSIEHWLPISADATKALDYNNIMLCCDGGRRASSMPHVTCCDAAKGDRIIKISPYKRDQMEKIRYRSDGTIHIYPADIDLQHDIDYVLKLNGEVDKDGKMISDTSTGLVYGRKQVYRYYHEYILLLKKKGKISAATIRKKIDELTQADEQKEFVGVWLYFLKRKLKSI